MRKAGGQTKEQGETKEQSSRWTLGFFQRRLRSSALVSVVTAEEMAEPVVSDHVFGASPAAEEEAKVPSVVSLK
ncbi:MAG: hypothetical protein P1U63_07795 [Coxiellaceae bacterium]|nr:hypothetical protein [Coxiellaceae bacterium]